MAIDITELRKSNGELRATVRYFDQIQRASERLGRTQYQNIMKLNNELKFTVRYFESAYRTALKLSRLRLMPTISLNDQATPALQRLLRKLRSVQDEAIHASGHYTVKQKLDVFIKGLKIPPPGPVNVTVDSNSNSNLLALLSSNKTEKAEEPKSLFDKILEWIDNANKVADFISNLIEVPEKIINLFKKNKDGNSENGSNADRAAKGNKKCCCCCNGGGGNKNGRRGSRNRGSGKGSGRGSNRNGSRRGSNSNGQRDRTQNNGGNRGNNRGGNGNGGSLSFSDRIKNMGKNVGQNLGDKWKAAKGFVSGHMSTGSGLLSQGMNGLKSLGNKAKELASTGWNKAKSIIPQGSGSGPDSGFLSRGMNALKNVGQKVTSSLGGGRLNGITDFAKTAGKGLAKGAGKIFRPLGAVMDIASIATATNGKERGAAIGSMIAGALGTLAGGALGSVVPGAGTAIGGIGGGMLFGAAGDWLGGKIGGLFDTKKAAAAPATSIATPPGGVGAVSAAKVAANPATVAASTANKNATGKDGIIQIDSNQMNAISSSLKDFKAEVTNAVSINIPAGAVQLTVKENELDYDALVLQIGQRVVNELRKSMQNRKSDSPGNTSAKPIMA